MNHYSLRHPSTIAKIDKAMREAIRFSKLNSNGVGYGWCPNKNGDTMLHVQYKRYSNGTTEMKFLDWKMNDVSETVKIALRESVK